MTNQVKKSKTEYEVHFLQGNALAIVSCNEVYFPGQNEFFVTLNDITFPKEDRVDTIHVPKHLILQIKTKHVEKSSNLRVLHTC